MKSEDDISWLDKIISSPTRTNRWLTSVLVMALVALIALPLIATLPDLISIAGRAEYGAFGDFVGGILNPILTFVTFVALLFTITLQRKELRDATHEFERSAAALEQQSFEATFFRMAGLIRETVSSIDIERKRFSGGKSIESSLVEHKDTFSGTDAFRYCYDVMKKRYNDENQGCFLNSHASYEYFYIKHGHEFGHYFRLLYNTFKYLSERKEKYSKGTGQVDLDYDFYAKILRAQISDYELTLLYYNSLSSRGKNFFLCSKSSPYLTI